MTEEKISQHIYGSEQELKEIRERVENVEKLVDSIRELAGEVKSMRGELNTLVGRISEIEKKPLKRYETFITAAITAVASLIIGFFLKGGL